MSISSLEAAASVGYDGLVAAILDSSYPKKDPSYRKGWRPKAFEQRDIKNAMERAALHGQCSTLKYLIKRYKRLPDQEYWRKPLLSLAVESGDIATVTLLISKGAKPQNNAQESTLHCAAKRGEDEIIELLLASGDNISKSDITGLTALHIAAKYGHVSTVKLLLEKGGDATALAMNYTGPLDMAAIGGHYDVVKVLMEHNPHITLAKKTTLHWATEYGRYKTASLLLSKGADKEACDENGLTPLHYAAKKGYAPLVELLLDHGADIEARAESNLTPLHYAVLGKHTGVVSVLAERGADMESKSGPGTVINGGSNIFSYPGGWTALFHAVMWTHPETVSRLLDCGANTDAVDFSGQTPLHVAAAWGKTRAVRALLASGISKETKGATGQTPFHKAAAGGHLETLMALVAGGCDINAVTDLGQSALHLAARYFYFVARYLLREGLDVHATDTLGRTPLHIAACLQKSDVAELLVSCGADINVRDNDGQTPLHYAALNDSRTLGFLVEKGGDKQAVDNSGHTPESVEHTLKDPFRSSMTKCVQLLQ